jgi:hypothetical protein
MLKIILGTGDIKEHYSTIFPFIIMPFGIFRFTEDGVEHLKSLLIFHDNEPYFVVDNYIAE